MKSLRSLLLASIVGSMSVCVLRAATLYWDPDGNAANNNFSTGTGLGGAGNWNTSNPFWNPGDPLSADIGWNNAGFDTAYFWGPTTPVTVTLTADITVGGLTFATTAYTLAGSNTLNFGGATNYIQLQNVAAATISAPITGPGDIVVASKTYGGQTAGTLTLSGGNVAFTGAVVIDNGMTVSLSGTGGTALSNTSGLTLNGGALTMTNTTNAMGALDRVNNGAPITSNGGTITYTNTAGSANNYAETLGVVTLNSGRLNIISTTATTTPATETLTLTGLIRAPSSTAVLAIGGGSVGANAQNRIVVTGMGATPAGQIVGPWATFGTSATAQTDYLIYDATNGFKGAAIGASTEDTWTTPANAYTANAATTLTLTRTITALRYSGAAADLTLAAGINLETYGILNGGTGALTVQPGTGGALTTPTGGGGLYFMTANAQAIVVNAPITDNGGVVKVVHTGGSTLTLANASNTFSGGLVINSGTISIASDAALGDVNGGVTFDGSAALTLTASSTLAATRTITINNTALATINTTLLTQTISGNITGTGGLIVNGGGTTNLNGTNNDFQGILRIGNGSSSTTVSLNSLADSAQATGAIRLGSGTLTGTFIWAATAVGDLTLNNRQIDLAGSTGSGVITNNSTFVITINTDLLVSGAGTKTFTLSGSGNGIFNGLIDGHGSVLNLTKSGAGTWTLASPKDDLAGTISVSQGTLVTPTLGSGTGALALGSSTTTAGILTYTGAGDTITRPISLAATTTGSGTLNASGTGALNWQGSVTTLGTTKTFTLSGTYTGSDNTFSGSIGIGTGNFAKNGAGTWVLTSANTFVNTTIGSSTLAGGTLRLTGAGTLGSGTLTVNNGVLDIAGTADVAATTLTMGGGPAGTQAAIHIGTGRTLTLGGNYTFSATNNNLGSVIDGLGTLNLGSATRTFTIGDSTTATNDVTISTLIIGDAAVGLSKAGTGTLVLTENNTYTGPTAITAGTLIVSTIGNSAALSSNLGAGNATLSIGSSTTTAGILTYTGAGESTDRALSLAATTTGAATINSSGTGALNWQGNVTSAGTTKTFTLGGAYVDTDNTFSGTINIGTGNLTKAGADTWVLTAANTYANTAIGSSTVAGGILRLTGAGTIGSGTLTISAGTLQVQGSTGPTVSALTMGGGLVGSSATIDLALAHTLTLGGNVTFSATNNNLTATITGGGGSILDFGGAVRTFTIGNSTTVDTDMLIDTNVTAQNGGLIKAGAGTLVLAGSNTLSSFEVQAGALVAPLGTANLVLNGGVFESSGLFTRDLGTGLNQVQWTAGANGGFSAHGGTLSVTLNSGAPLGWDSTPSFVSGAGQLLFGSVTSDNVVTLTNDLDLNNTASTVTRTIQVVDNAGSTADKTVVSGVLSASGAGPLTLAKSGTGVLELQGNNTFVGTVSISAGTLQFSSVNNLGNSGNNPISLAGGTLQYLGTGAATLGGALTVTATSTIANTSTGTLQLSGGVTMPASLNLNGTSLIAFTNTIVNTATTGVITVNTTAGATFNNLNLTDSSTARTLVINVAAGVTATVNGVVANGGTGSSAFRKDGPGLLILNGANTFTNELRLNQGTLQINVTPAVLQTSGNSIVLNNGNVLGATSTLLLNADYNLNGTVVYVGNTSNAQGTATITGPGKLNLNATRNFDIRPSTDPTGKVVVATEIANGTAASGLTKIRYGTLVLSADNTYTGNTTVNEGRLILDYTTNTGSKISSTALLSFGGGILELDGNVSTDVTQSVTGLTVGAGGSSLVLDSTAGGAVTLNVGGALTSTSAGRSIDFMLLGSSSIIDTTGGTGWTVANGILGGWATYNGSAFATVNGNGRVVGVDAAGKDNVGTWSLGENIVDDAGYSGTMATAVRINSLAFNAAATSTVNVNRVFNLDSGGVLVAASVGANDASINGGNLITAGSAFFIQQFNTTRALTITSAIRGNTSLTKSGGGDLILNSSTNDYTGVTQINHGTVIVMGGNAIGDASAVTLDGAPDVMLKLLDDETIGSLAGGGADGGTVDIGSHTLTLTNGATFSGSIVGNGTIIKNGTATLLFNTATSPQFTGTVIAEQALVELTGSGIANLGAVTSLVINPNGALLVDNNGASTTANRILDTASLTLNSANGLNSTNAPFRGLWVRTDQNGTRNENVGGVTFNSGASYATFEVSTTVANTASISELVASGFTRNNNATLAVRGMNLGTSASIQRGRLRLVTASESAFTTANLIGGAGGVASSTISIVPWVIGQDLGTILLSTTVNNERGNSLVTYVTGVGFRPLNFVNEYINYGSAVATSNVRESLAGDLTGLTGQTINSLVLNNASASAGVTVSGSGALVVTSGAFLFTAVDGSSATGAELGTPQAITLNGFSTITVGPVVGLVGNEFIFHVEDSSAGGVTISSNLVDSTAGGTSLTKSGLGTLFLTGTNAYTGITTINEGTLDISAWSAIGGATGNTALVMAGGTLRLEAAFTGDFSRPIQLAEAGGTLNMDASVAFNGVISNLAGMNGSLTKSGPGTLTVNAPATYSGPTSILGGVWTLGVNQGLGLGDLIVNNATLDMQGFNATVGKVTLANAAGSLIDGTGALTSNGTVFDVQQGVINAALAGTSGLTKSTTSTGSVTLNALNTYTGVTEIRVGTLVIKTIKNVGGGASSLGAPTTVANGTIRIGSTTNAGILQYTGTGDSSDRRFELVGTTGGFTITQNGTGALVLSGDILNAGPGNKTLTLQGTSLDDNILSSNIDEGGNGVIALTKTNTGKWILAGNNNYTGNTQISQGTLSFSAAANLGDTSSVALILLGNSTTTGGTLLYTGAGDTINDKLQFNNTTGGSTINASGTGALIFADLNPITALAGSKTVTLTGTSTDANEIKGVIQNNSGTNLTSISKTGSGLWVLSGGNAYTGSTTINGPGGTLRVAAGGALGIGAIVVTAGTLDLQNGTQNITTLTMGNGVVGSTSDVDINGGILNLGGNVTVTASSTAGIATIEHGTLNLLGDRTFTINDSTATDVDMQINAVVVDGDATARAFIKAGNGTLVFNSANSYTGITSINAGILRFAVTQNITGALQFGSTGTTTTAGTLDLSTVSAAFPSLTVQTNSSTSADSLIIGAGQTLTINGNVALGSSAAASTVTLFNVTGDGSFIVNNPLANGTFLVGGTTSAASQGSKTTVDLSGLAQFTVTLNTTNGVFRVNPTNATNVSDKYSTLTLAQNNNITAATFSVGDGAENNASAGQINTLFLGAVTNVLNVNTLNIGSTNRDLGQILFAGSTGSVTINNTAGTGRTVLNMGTAQTTGVGAPLPNTFDVTGHTATLLFGVVSIGTATRGASYSNIFSFDTGTLDMTSLTMSIRSADNTNGAGLARDTTSTFNIGGGTVSIQSGITSMATAAGAYTTNPLPNVTGTVNISGGTVSIGATAGNSISMGNFTATGGTGTGSAVATVNITGGVTTLTGNIVKLGTSGFINATVNLDGGTLDMGGKAIGAAGASAINFTAQSGTLKNLGQLNGGADLTKTSGGTLILDGTNTYSGQTIVNEGTVLVSGSISGTAMVNDGGTLGGSGGTTGAVLITSGGTLAPGASAGTLNTGAINLAFGGHISLELGATVAGTGYDQLKVTGGVSLSGDIQLSLITGFADQIDDTYYVLLNDGSDAITGTFSNVTPLTATTGTITLANGRQFLVNYAANAPLGDGGGNDISVTLTAVPEPGSLSLLVASLGLTLGWQRLRLRRRR